jgi:DNA ligase (NAD+)
MDIEHLGQAAIDQLVDRGMVKDFADLYDRQRVNVDSLSELERLAEKSAQNLVDAIDGSKRRGLSRLLNALGIRMVGERVAALLARHFGSMTRLHETSLEELSGIHGIGAQIAQSVRTFFDDETNRDVIRRLGEAGVELTEPGFIPEGPKPLAGKTFVLTGVLPSLTREAARETIERLGGRITSAVSKKTDYVVVGDAPGSKADDARKLGVTVLDEAQFLALVGRR